MVKVVINRCYGGFGLSFEACKLIAERKGWTLATDDYDREYFIPELGKDQRLDPYDLERNDPILVAVVEELGEDADGYGAELKVVNIPEDIKWHIHDYDGMETIREDHRTWI